MPARTLFDKLWDAHAVAELGDGTSLLYVDRLLLHDMSGRSALKEIGRRGLSVRDPSSVFAVPDHLVSSAPGRSGGNSDWSNALIDGMRANCRKWGIRLFDVNEPEQGIVHVVGPELGLTQPGTLLLCGDSHTSTHGALGALAWGVGASELVHVLATHAIVQKRPRRMRVVFSGRRGAGVEAKDLILYLIGREGVAAGTGYAVEYAGSAIRDMDLEGRMTLCNLSIEWGAKVGVIAPDERTYAWLAGRRYAPSGGDWDAAQAYWQTLATDSDARFERELEVDASRVQPQLTWGTSPQDVVGVDARVPDPAAASDPRRRAALQTALEYMGLAANAPIAGTRIDRAFIGSCTNARLGDLRRAAELVRRSGGRVAPHVRAWVVPGSQRIKREAEAEGLDGIFRAAGFDWREPGCALCAGSNGEVIAPLERCMSTSNRNFVGRQGPRARTHLASPTMVAAAALAGEIVDARTF